MAKKAKKLNNQEQVFVDQYLISLDPEDAALKAKYAKTTAGSKARMWVANSRKNPKPHVYAAIKKKMAVRSEKTGIKAEQVIEEFVKIAFANQQDYLGADNSILDISQIDRDKAAAVESVQTTTTTTTSKKGDEEYETHNVKIKLYSKISALENLGKHLGIYEKDNSQQGMTLADFLKAMKND